MSLLKQLLNLVNMQEIGGQVLQTLGIQTKRNNRSRWGIVSLLSILAAGLTLGFLRMQNRNSDDQPVMMDTTQPIFDQARNAGRLKPLIEMANEFAPELKK